MVKVRHEKLNKEIDIERILGKYTQNKQGPTVIFLCGTHGNETSSVFAIHEIFEKLEQHQPDINGEMVAAFAGNLEALKQDVRYIDNDLNRGWVTKRLKQLGFLTEEDELHGHEKKEQHELMDVLQKAIGRAHGDIFVFDLHTTSSASPPFTAISDTIRNREIALKFPLPCVLGFDEQTKGTFMNFINDMGLAGVAFEAGEHYALSSVENNVNFIWTAMKLVGSIDESQIPDYKKIYSLLGKEKFGSHKIFDLIYRYPVKEEDAFRMKSGYSTFDEIEKGEHLADDKDGPVYAPESGRIFMPLYQKQGNDGYFIVREKSEEWLKLSEKMRRANDDRHLTDLEGVEKHPDDEHTLVIDKELFPDIRDRLHLMGYRREMRKDGKVIITRRVYDVKAPDLEKLKSMDSLPASFFEAQKA